LVAAESVGRPSDETSGRDQGQSRGSGDWYLMPHDEMLVSAEADGVTKTASWIDGGAYSRPRLSAAVIAKCAPYRFAPIAEVAAKAAEDSA
jgi:hypothetical protein